VYSLATLVFAFVALTLLLGVLLVVLLRRRFVAGRESTDACAGNGPERTRLSERSDK